MDGLTLKAGFSPAGRGVAAWLLCGLAATAAATGTFPAIAADAAHGAGEAQAAEAPGAALIDFDIPAQPLGDALDRYAAMSKRTVLFQSELASGRTSSSVVGRYTFVAALDLLLAGTGLAVKKNDDGPADAFILVQAVTAAGKAAADTYDGIDGLVGDRRYPGRVQGRIWQALCRNPGTAPGAYRVLLRLQLDEAGRLLDVRLLHSSGDAGRDEAVVRALQDLRVDPPPADMVRQALTLLIAPASLGGPRCSQPAERP